MSICWRFLVAVFLWRLAPHNHIRRRSCPWSPAHSKPVAGQARHFTQRQVLFPAATTTPHRTFARRRLHRHTGACVCRQPRRLLYRSTGWCGGAPKKTTDKLQRVLRAAARDVSNRGKYDRRLTYFRRHVLHWFDVSDRIRFSLCVQVYKCQHNILCRPVSTIDGHWHRCRRRGGGKFGQKLFFRAKIV